MIKFLKVTDTKTEEEICQTDIKHQRQANCNYNDRCKSKITKKNWTPRKQNQMKEITSVLVKLTIEMRQVFMWQQPDQKAEKKHKATNGSLTQREIYCLFYKHVA